MASTFVPGSSAQPKTEVELSISCRSLPRMDLLSMSDPMCVTYVRPFGQERWVEYHRTECIDNCHDPNFTRKMNMMYRFEEQQLLCFEVYDIDTKSSDLADHDFIGTAFCSLGQIVGSGMVKLPLTDKNHEFGGQRGFILITAEELSSIRDELISLRFSGHNLDRKDWFGLSDPFLEFYKSMESGEYVLVHKTEVKKWTLNPRWAQFTISVRTLCNGDYDRDLKILCYDWNASGKHSFIGQFNTNLNNLKLGRGPHNCYQCIHPQKQAKKGNLYKGSGHVVVEYFRLEPIYSFLDFIRGGTKLNCTIAIDFTASNGNPSSPLSLHYITGVRQNCYELAIQEVVSIIQDYDSNKAFPVLGFGARLPPDGKISHEFYVNMDKTNPYCSGVNGVLEAYRSCLRQIQLYGPTNFAPVIKHVTQFARTYEDGSRYFILLILTDGVITDMQETIQAIITASVLPLSIIIVGVGDADFGAMETLDADTVALSYGGVSATRDIVQFVPFNKFINNGDLRTARMRLAKEVLAEVPTQLVGYMKSRNIVPNPPQNNEVFLPPDPERLSL